MTSGDVTFMPYADDLVAMHRAGRKCSKLTMSNDAAPVPVDNEERLCLVCRRMPASRLRAWKATLPHHIVGCKCGFCQ